MNRRIAHKIFKNSHSGRYSINQLLYATRGTIIWWHMENGYDYHISYCCGKITKILNGMLKEYFNTTSELIGIINAPASRIASSDIYNQQVCKVNDNLLNRDK